MKIETVIDTDVLIIGAGLAGVSAAIAAGRTGARVILTSTSSIFSGSSFYPGTWGFGLIAPENDTDAQDLKNTICEIGMGMANEELVDTLVGNIRSNIKELESYGIPLKRPEQSSEREYIPCFDHKNRDWYGLIQQDTKIGLNHMLTSFDITQLPRTQIIELLMSNNTVCGALALTPDGIVKFSCGSCIIATGGLGGLFKDALTTSDVCGMGQYLALKAGAKLVNLEFQQMMPGYIIPCPKTIYNEKVFRYTNFYDKNGKSLFNDLSAEETKRILEIRSGHGPFTSRLDSKEVDIRLYKSGGATIRYENIPNPMPEFVQTYFEWLRIKKNVTEKDSAQLGIFYHAANGGIQIDKNAFTGVQGLYACGECTGGMHGADRLGGLSTANGLVFGGIAGRNAAANAKEHYSVSLDNIPLLLAENPKDTLTKLKIFNSSSAMIIRSYISENICTTIPTTKTNIFSTKLAESYQLYAALTLSHALKMAISLRRESRGSHYRIDFPTTDINYNKRILLSMKENKINANFE